VKDPGDLPAKMCRIAATMAVMTPAALMDAGDAVPYDDLPEGHLFRLISKAYADPLWGFTAPWIGTQFWSVYSLITANKKSNSGLNSAMKSGSSFFMSCLTLILQSIWKQKKQKMSAQSFQRPTGTTRTAKWLKS